METSLHRELKEFYCDDAAGREVCVEGYRIDKHPQADVGRQPSASDVSVRCQGRYPVDGTEVGIVGQDVSFLPVTRRLGPDILGLIVRSPD